MRNAQFVMRNDNGCAERKQRSATFFQDGNRNSARDAVVVPANVNQLLIAVAAKFVAHSFESIEFLNATAEQCLPENFEQFFHANRLPKNFVEHVSENIIVASHENIVKKPRRTIGGAIFSRVTRSVVEDIFQRLNIHVAVELRKVRRELD